MDFSKCKRIPTINFRLWIENITHTHKIYRKAGHVRNVMQNECEWIQYGAQTISAMVVVCIFTIDPVLMVTVIEIFKSVCVIVFRKDLLISGNESIDEITVISGISFDLVLAFAIEFLDENVPSTDTQLWCLETQLLILWLSGRINDLKWPLKLAEDTLNMFNWIIDWLNLWMIIIYWLQIGIWAIQYHTHWASTSITIILLLRWSILDIYGSISGSLLVYNIS